MILFILNEHWAIEMFRTIGKKYTLCSADIVMILLMKTYVLSNYLYFYSETKLNLCPIKGIFFLSFMYHLLRPLPQQHCQLNWLVYKFVHITSTAADFAQIAEIC